MELCAMAVRQHTHDQSVLQHPAAGIPQTHAECAAAMPPVKDGVPQSKLIFLGGHLCLQLTPSKPDANDECAISRSWVFSSSLHGQKIRLGFGSVSEITLERARAKVDRLQEDVDNGIDPQEQRREKKAAYLRNRDARKVDVKTFQVCAAEFLEVHKPEWSAIHYEQCERTLRPRL
jgi:hypothetical protein